MTSIRHTLAEKNSCQAIQISLIAGFFTPVTNSLHSIGATVIYDGGYGVEELNKGLITPNKHPEKHDRRKLANVYLIEAIAVITNNGFIKYTLETVMSKQLTADFHGTLLTIVEHNNQPYVSAKQITEAIGLDWKTQYRKLNSCRERWTMVKMPMVAPDGKQRSTVCLPLRKLPGWLMTIQPNKLSNELRPRIIQYQTECDDILWQHWEKEKSAPAALPAPSDAANETLTIVTIIEPGKPTLSQSYQGKVAMIPYDALLGFEEEMAAIQRKHQHEKQDRILKLMRDTITVRSTPDNNVYLKEAE